MLRHHGSIGRPAEMVNFKQALALEAAEPGANSPRASARHGSTWRAAEGDGVPFLSKGIHSPEVAQLEIGKFLA